MTERGPKYRDIFIVINVKKKKKTLYVACHSSSLSSSSSYSLVLFAFDHILNLIASTSLISLRASYSGGFLSVDRRQISRRYWLLECHLNYSHSAYHTDDIIILCLPHSSYTTHDPFVTVQLSGYDLAPHRRAVFGGAEALCVDALNSKSNSAISMP